MNARATARARRERAEPPPADWPDGTGGSVWREDLVCGLMALHADLPRHTVRLLLADGSVADMTGAIALALDIDPRCRLVHTFSNGTPNVAYLLTAAGWQARCARPEPEGA